LNILLAEDDKNLGIIIKTELEEEKYVVDLVNDGVDAVLNFIDKPYDFFLFDIKMPKLDGINTLKIIKKLNPDITAIAFSGNATHNEVEESLKNGALMCLIKPFEIKELKHYLRRCSGN
jgi:DNA-binding response OmpR family regulator